ncbi:MAG: ABC transporter ATP-binding protein [Deltaproteobacteria bacterium]|nr:ABC transporter ATP-binding protein [Deltaproteobacteria bacterium]
MSERVALVVAQSLTKVFRTPFLRRRVEALRGVSFAVEEGSVTGFLGANGAGKTTTLKVLLGLLAPTSGSAMLFGEPVPSRRSRERVGFMPETPSFSPNLTALEIVAFSARLQGTRDCDARAEEALRRAGLEASAWTRPTASLSKGQGQRVGLAAAIVSGPELLILDEPMSGLDPIGRTEVRALIAEEHARGRTILFSTHVLSDAEELCTHVCMIDRGAVVVDASIASLLAADDGRFGARFSDGSSVEVESERALDLAVAEALARGARVREVMPRRRRLQEVFDAHVTRG